MIFTPESAAMVLDGRKTQTRRPVKPGDKALRPFDEDTIFEVRHFRYFTESRGRRKWKLAETYAVQPGRGKKAIGRIRITKIRGERLQEISLQDLQAELGQPGAGYGLVFFFVEIWDKLYGKPYRWSDNPEVWVLELERMGRR